MSEKGLKPAPSEAKRVDLVGRRLEPTLQNQPLRLRRQKGGLDGVGAARIEGVEERIAVAADAIAAEGRCASMRAGFSRIGRGRAAS